MPVSTTNASTHLFQALVDRDAWYDGLTYATVRSTGIYCRPSCPSRAPKPENVGFVPTPADAESGGFRACKRCHPAEGRWQDASWLPADFASELNRTAPSVAVEVMLSRVWTPLGVMIAGATDEGLCLLEFSNRRMLGTQIRRLCQRLRCSFRPGRHAWTDRCAAELAEYFGGTRRQFTVPLVMPGSPFQTRVWEELVAVPYGETRSYGELAVAVDRPGAMRAVGTANGDNRLAVVVPCHRVIGADGALRGYGGKLWRKRRLLELEGALPA